MNLREERAVRLNAMSSRNPNRLPSAGNSLLRADIADVERYAITDEFGHIVENAGFGDVNETELYAGQLIIGSLDNTGNLLGLGAISFVTVKSPQGTKLLARHDGYTVALALRNDQSLARLEQRLIQGTAILDVPTELDSKDLSIEPNGDPRPDPSKATVAQTIPLVNAPPRPGPIAPLSPNVSKPSRAPREKAPVPHVREPYRVESSDSPIEPQHLRRAVERGDLSIITKIAERMLSRPAPSNGTNDAVLSVQAILPLSSAIASILSGDNQAGLSTLDALNQLPDVGATLSWASLFWSARASIGLQEGLDSALVYAESAARVAKKLDVETRVSSHRLLAEICYYRGDAKSADRYVELAKRLIEPLDNQEVLAELALQRAKIAILDDNLDGAITAAEEARTRRADWSAPTIFLCQCTLSRSDVRGARDLVNQLVAAGANTPEVVRLEGLVKAAETQSVPATTIAEFLLLDDAPPTKTNLGRLERLVASHPRQYVFADTLGWKYVKSGRAAAAQRVFDRLGESHELPDDIRSSVMLALGCLKSLADSKTRDGQHLQAVVNAAPTHLKSERPPARTSSQHKAAKPIELVDFSPPSSSLTYESPNPPSISPNLPQTQNRVFAGNLAVFTLPDLLEFLRAGRRTGTLVCSSSIGLGAMQLVDGRITGATAPHTPSFQELVLETGLVTSNQLESYANAPTKEGTTLPLGTRLVQASKLTQAQLERLLTKQITLAITELLQWVEGQFAFEPESMSATPASVLEVSVDPQSILLEIFKTLDECKR